MESEGLVHVSTPLLLCATAPLFALALASWSMGLELESPIVVGMIRTSVQLTVLGIILQPIFVYGVDHWWLVLLYILFMVVLASLESSARSKYYFEGMFSCVLASFLVNIGLMSIFAFGYIIRPHPVWDPQYVIPIVGMLLGNCINGIALSMNAVLISLVEQSQEVELFLSFGASSSEASARLLIEAIRVGTMPMLNSMAVIGLISIPGMMTGQILGGTPVMEAARYQMLICYLIATCAFGTILSEVWIARRVAFDVQTEMLCTGRFIKRATKLSFLGRIGAAIRYIWNLITGSLEFSSDQNGSSEEMMSLPSSVDEQSSAYVAPKGTLEVYTLHPGDDTQSTPNLELRNGSLSIAKGGRSRTLFSNVSIKIHSGDIVVVRGPSGVGKSQLLRLIAGLSPMDKGGRLLLKGWDRNQFSDPAQWRRQVRYVSQYKIDIPGTPRQFIERVSSFQSWQHQNMPSLNEMVSASLQLIQTWGLDANYLDQEWKLLSGGEAQRIYNAIALVSRPRVLLMDESTSALDRDAKTRVEKSVAEVASKYGISVVWITHDEDQLERMADSEHDDDGSLSMWNRRLSDYTRSSSDVDI